MLWEYSLPISRLQIMRKSTLQWEAQHLVGFSLRMLTLHHNAAGGNNRASTANVILKCCLRDAVKPQQSCPGYISSAVLFLLPIIFAFLLTGVIGKGLKGHALPTHSPEASA